MSNEKGQGIEDTLTASEALYGFAGWLTSQPYAVVMSSRDDAAFVADLVELYCETNELAEPRPSWNERLRYPAVFPRKAASFAPEYDPGLHVTAGELRALQLRLPASIPDCASVPRQAVVFDHQKLRVRKRGDEGFGIDVPLRILVAFRWRDADGKDCFGYLDGTPCPAGMSSGELSAVGLPDGEPTGD